MTQLEAELLLKNALLYDVASWAVEEIKRLQKAGRWIPVAEQVPDKTEWCLCYGDGAIMCYAWNAQDKRWEDWVASGVLGLPLDAITHWMSMPQSPEIQKAARAKGSESWKSLLRRLNKFTQDED